jgi:tetratricopeptide (TPR) repeat protein
MEIASKAGEYFLQGFRLYNLFTPKSNAQAQEMFQRAIDADTTFARAYGSLAYAKLIAWLNGWTDSKTAPREMRSLADKAVKHDPNDYDNLWSQAGIYLFTAKYQTDSASAYKMVLKLFDTALKNAESQAIDFNVDGLRVDFADVLFFTGTKQSDVDEAIRIANEAIDRVASGHPKRFLWTLGWAFYERAWFTRNREDYIQSLDALLQIANPQDLIVKCIMANYAALGWSKPAQRLARDFVSRNPNYTLAVEDRWPYRDPKRLERWKSHLRQAGLPDKRRTAR